MTYRVYQHESGKLWAVKPIEGRSVSTRWGPLRPDRRLPFEKTRQGEMQSLISAKLAKGYAFFAEMEYDDSGFPVVQGKTVRRPLHEGFALELTSPWEMDAASVAQVHDELRSTLQAMAERTDLITYRDGAVRVGQWSLQIGADLDFGMRFTTLLIPRDEPLPILLLAALRNRLELRFRQGFCLSFPDGAEVPDDPMQILGSGTLLNMFRLQKCELRELLEHVGLLDRPIDWTTASATGSDWF